MRGARRRESTDLDWHARVMDLAGGDLHPIAVLRSASCSVRAQSQRAARDLGALGGGCQCSAGAAALRTCTNASSLMTNDGAAQAPRRAHATSATASTRQLRRVIAIGGVAIKHGASVVAPGDFQRPLKIFQRPSGKNDPKKVAKVASHYSGTPRYRTLPYFY